MNDAPDGTLNYTRTDSIALPQSTSETRIAIRMSDWARLKRTIHRCKSDHHEGFSGWYFCSFGISGSAALSIIPLQLSSGVPLWTVPLYICICIFALVLGYVLWKIDQGRTANEAVQLQELQTEMTEIENGFQMSSTPTP